MNGPDAAIVLAQMASDRSSNGEFAPKDLNEVYVQAGIPISSKVSNQIASLRRLGYVREAGQAGAWKLTPAGRARIGDLLNGMDMAALKAEAEAANGSLLGGEIHSVVAPTWAPPAILPQLRSFLSDYPFETNVFGMTRFPSDDPKANDPVALALEVAKSACSSHGLVFHLASDPGNRG